jgi:hypothetical protein
LPVWDPTTGKVIHELEHPESVLAVAFSADGKFLATGSGGHGDDEVPPIIRIWDLTTGKTVRKLEGHKGWFNCLAFAPDGKTLASVSSAKGVCLWDVEGGRLRRTLPEDRGWINTVAFSTDGRTLAVGNGFAEQSIHLWEMATARERHELRGHLDRVETLAFSRDGRKLVSGSADTTALVWDVRGTLAPPPTPKELETLWNALGSDDAREGYRALRALTAAGDPGVDVLKAYLKPVPARDDDCIARLIRDLENDQFAVRARATEELERLADLAEPQLRHALKGEPALELRQRVTAILERLEPVAVPDTLRRLRGVEALEYIGTPAARALLQALAAGNPEAPLTREARGSLARLAP